MPTTHRNRYDCTLTHSVALTCPAARTFAVLVCRNQSDDPDEREIYVYRVQAIRTSVVSIYRAIDREPRKGATHDEMIRNGWQFDEQEMVTENLIQSLDYGLVDVDFALGNGLNHRVIACTWPESEDRVRLMGVAQDLLRGSEPCTGVLGTLKLDPATGLYEEQTAPVDEPDDGLSQRDVDLVMRALAGSPTGLTATQITNDVFKKNQRKGLVNELLTTLHAKGLIHPVKSEVTKGRAGRPAVTWFAGPGADQPAAGIDRIAKEEVEPLRV